MDGGFVPAEKGRRVDKLEQRESDHGCRFRRYAKTDSASGLFGVSVCLSPDFKTNSRLLPAELKGNLPNPF
jgi:hypothetical protein